MGVFQKLTENVATLKNQNPPIFILIAILSAPYGTLEIQSRRLSSSLNCILFSAWLDFIGTYGGTYTSAILSPELYSHSTNHIANMSANQKTSWMQINGPYYMGVQNFISENSSENQIFQVFTWRQKVST